MSYDFEEDILYIFTDGSSRPSLWVTPKKRVWWMWIIFAYCGEDGYVTHEDVSNYVGYIGSTNNDMELLASIEWLQIAYKLNKRDCFKKIIVVSDSRLVTDNARNAIFGVRAKRWWKTVYWDPVIHKEEWKSLKRIVDKLYNEYRVKVEFDRVKWHKDNEYNNMADKAASKGAKFWIQKKISKTSPRKPFLLNWLWHKWFLPVHWETFYIHIHSHRPLTWKRFRFNYTLLSPSHEYFNYKSRIYHDKALSSKNIYLIRASSDWSHMIEEIVDIITKEEIREIILTHWFDESIFYWRTEI